MDGVSKLKTEVFDHFKRQLSESTNARPSFTSTNFIHLPEHQSKSLEFPISNEEIKAAVWACEGSKAPEPDDFTFNFIKAH